MAAPTRLSSPHPPRGAWEPRALRRVQPPSAALGRSVGRLPSICAEPPLGAPKALGMPPPRGPAALEAFPNAGSSPSSPAGDGEVGAGVHPERAPAHAHPPGPDPFGLPSLPDNASGSAARLRTRPGTTAASRNPSVLCCPASPLPRGSSGCSYLRPSSSRRSGGRRGRPTPVLSRRRGTGGGRGCCGPPPRAPLPTACSPSRRRGSAFALRVRASRAACAAGGAAAGKRVGAEPGSPSRRLRSRRRSPSRAERERSERPGSGREQKGPALGRAREGGAWRGGGQAGARAASRFSGCGAAPQGGGRAEDAPAPRPPAPRGGQWLGVRTPHFGAGHLSALPSRVTEESILQPCSAHKDVPDP